ncbi:MAG: O-methyltransferase [Haloarculaceae archaeon]
MDDIPVSDAVARFARAVGPAPDDVLAEMDAHAEDVGFPTVGPEVGGWLRLLARAVDAERAFEFGSGFGYSAYWLAGALPADGQVVLTEVDADELDLAREYLARGGYDDRAVFEHGDAVDVVADYDGPFDVVLIDNEKDRYVEAFEAVREAVQPGGIVLADNAMTAGHVDFEALLADADGGDPAMNDATRGIADYLARVGDDPDFETTLLPLGEGVTVSLRHR